MKFESLLTSGQLEKLHTQAVMYENKNIYSVYNYLSFKEIFTWTM